MSTGYLYGIRHTRSTHSIDFATLIELGKKLKIVLPENIIIIGIEVEDASTFTEKCSPRVERAIYSCVDKIMRILNGDNSATGGFGQSGAIL